VNEPLLVKTQDCLRCITYQKVSEGLKQKIYSIDNRVYLSRFLVVNDNSFHLQVLLKEQQFLQILWQQSRSPIRDQRCC